MADLGLDLFDESVRDRIEKRLWALTVELLQLGQTVILEFGFLIRRSATRNTRRRER